MSTPSRFRASLLWGCAACLSATAAYAAVPGPAVRLFRSGRTGQVIHLRSANGLPLAVRAATGRAPLAADFLAQFGAHFGVSDPGAQLVASHADQDFLGGKTSTFYQVERGVPVFSGILKVRQDAYGRFTGASGRFYPISPKLDVDPAIDAAAAEAAAVADLGVGAPYCLGSELVIVDPGWYGDTPLGARLAYHLVLEEPEVGLLEAFFIDAHCGEVIDRWSMMYTILDRDVYDASGGTLPGVLVRSEGQGPVADPEVNRAYDYGGDTYYYYLRAFGRDGIDNLGSTIIQSVNRTFSCPNASWNGVQASYCPGVTPDDVIAHELTHGVTQYTANLIYQNQSGQLNESMSDIFGEMVDLFNGDAAFAGPPGGTPWPLPPPVGPGTDTPNSLRTGCGDGGVRWLVGEDSTAFGGAIRDMWDPPCYADPDYANSPLQTCNPVDSGGVHSGSGVPNHAFALLVDGGSFNGYTIGAIGPIKAAAIWYRALTDYLTPASDFEDAYYALNQAGEDLLGTTPNDPRTGAPSASAITAADLAALDAALLATEMNTAGACGQGDDVLSAEPAFEYPLQTAIFADDFEGGVNGWTVANSAPPLAYDWVQTADLPLHRAGSAWYCADPSIGDCGGTDVSGTHSLTSPSIAIPPGASGLRMRFAHYLATEGGWDGGNVKYSVNGGAFSVIPARAFRHNACNGRINTSGQGNTNPLQGQDGWTGAGGGWGVSLIDLTGLVSGGQSLRVRFDFGKDGCTGADGWYVDDFAIFAVADCDANAEPDDVQFRYAHCSGPLGPIGAGSSQSYVVLSPPNAVDSDVAMTFTAVADIGSTTEYFEVRMNGTLVGTVFNNDASDCNFTPDRETLIVPAATFNAAKGAGNLTILLTATSEVGATNCSGTSYVAFQVQYLRAQPADCNGNFVPDACDIAFGLSEDCNGNNEPDECDLAVGSEDCNGNGALDECDLALGISEDCNGNGQPDECDISQGLSPDHNGNGIPDGCEPRTPKLGSKSPSQP